MAADAHYKGEHPVAFQVTYARDTYRPDDVLIAGNSVSTFPVEFDICPAEGPDLARIRSILVATAGLVNEQSWSPDMQAAVISAFETGAPAFINTVEAVRGLTIPAAMAKRVGIISEVPTHVPQGSSTPVPNTEAPIPITTGLHFSRICGFVNLSALSMQLASKIAELSNRVNVDPRLFVQPSGSGGTTTPGQMPTAVAPAKSQPEGKGTATSRTRQRQGQPPKNHPAGTSSPDQS
jgi:hypothetical protein